MGRGDSHDYMIIGIDRFFSTTLVVLTLLPSLCPEVLGCSDTGIYKPVQMHLDTETLCLAVACNVQHGNMSCRCVVEEQ